MPETSKELQVRNRRVQQKSLKPPTSYDLTGWISWIYVCTVNELTIFTIVYMYCALTIARFPRLGKDRRALAAIKLWKTRPWKFNFVDPTRESLEVSTFRWCFPWVQASQKRSQNMVLKRVNLTLKTKRSLNFWTSMTVLFCWVVSERGVSAGLSRSSGSCHICHLGNIWCHVFCSYHFLSTSVVCILGGEKKHLLVLQLQQMNEIWWYWLS